MIKKTFHAAALLILCALLVYAPELLASVSAPYGVRTDARALLRIALCTEDDAAASAFYKAVSSYQKETRALHLRVTRVAPDRIANLPAPGPDLYVFSPGAIDAPQTLLLPLRSEENAHDPALGTWDGMRYAAALSAGEGGTLLCAVAANARERVAAQAFVTQLLDMETAQP